MTARVATADWVAVDWGTTNLRVWVIGGNGEIIDHIRSSHGIAGLEESEFEPLLAETLKPYVTAGTALTVVCCGMAGSRQGWHEAPYVPTPCAPLGTRSIVSVPSGDRRLNVHIAAGVKQSDPADVMRGEETQIAGVLHRHRDFAGYICLPGTHSKWAYVESGDIMHFKTFMTGEMFSLLAKQSVLRHSLNADACDHDAFLQGVKSVLADPAGMAAALFGLRAGDLLSATKPEVSGGLLSGYLIGAEVAAIRRDMTSVTIVGAPRLSRLYADALALTGIESVIEDGTECTLAGLRAARDLLGETR